MYAMYMFVKLKDKTIELQACYFSLDQGVAFLMLLPVLFMMVFAYLRLIFYRVSGFLLFQAGSAKVSAE